MSKELLVAHQVLMGMILICFVFCCKAEGKDQSNEIETTLVSLSDSVWFEYEEITGIGHEVGVSRRDPSDIIKVGNLYYVWFTRIPATTNGRRTPLYNSGYYGTIWYATSSDGYSWTEKGKILCAGEAGAFDSHAVFTPNILQHDGRYYLYYTGVRPTPGNLDYAFENNSENDITAIGLAVADNPDGPYVRISSEPILKISYEEADFDSYRIDDAALLVKDKEIRLYYKGRSSIHGKTGAGKTHMGVALADDPEGPYKKHGPPLLNKSHEVLIWNQDNGVATLTSINRAINLLSDGLDFSAAIMGLVQIPKAPGLFRPHLTDPKITEIPGWGISHENKDGDMYLRRFTIISE